MTTPHSEPLQVESVSFSTSVPQAKFVVLCKGRRIVVNLTWVGDPLDLPESWEVSLMGEIEYEETQREQKLLGRWIP